MRKNQRCTVRKKNNKRCKNNAIWEGFCKTHTKTNLQEKTPWWKSQNFKINFSISMCAVAFTSIVTIFITLYTGKKTQIPINNDHSINIEQEGDGPKQVNIKQQTGFADEQYDQLKKSIASLNEEEKTYNEVKNILGSGHEKNAVILLDKLAQKQQAKLAETLYKTGFVNNSVGGYYKAKNDFEKAYQLSPNNLRYLSTTGLINETIGQHEISISRNKMLLELTIKRFGNENNITNKARYSLGDAYLSNREFSKGLEQFEIAFSYQQKLFNNAPRELAIGMGFLGEAYSNLGQHKKGINFAKKSLKIMSETLPPNHLRTILGHNTLAMAYAGNKQFAKAEKNMRVAISKINEISKFDQAVTIQLQTNLVITLQGQNKFKESIPIIEKVIADSKLLFHQNYEYQRENITQLGMAYHATKRFTEAKHQFNLALNLPESKSKITDAKLLSFIAIIDETKNRLYSLYSSENIDTVKSSQAINNN